MVAPPDNFESGVNAREKKTTHIKLILCTSIAHVHIARAWIDIVYYIMGCYHPIELTPYGHVRPVIVPCGRCIGCRIEKSRTWAIRIMCESRLKEENRFLTLTYEKDIHTLNKKDIILFVKRLRKRVGEKLRYYQCGEYGERHWRPHHHMILFGYKFTDEKIWPEPSKSGERQYVSDTLNGLWGNGMCWIGDVTFDSAAYVAGYVTKKFTNKDAEEIKKHYQGRLPEYATMSRRPGIGAGFVDKYYSDIYNGDRCLVRKGVEIHPPRYFDDRARKTHKEDIDQTKLDRQVRIRNGQKITPFELDTLERTAKINQQRNKREF